MVGGSSSDQQAALVDDVGGSGGSDDDTLESLPSATVTVNTGGENVDNICDVLTLIV
jgi:hypothetical protein